MDLLLKYVERFGDNFPTHLMLGVDESEINKIILKCLETNTPYEAEDLGPEYDY